MADRKVTRAGEMLVAWGRQRGLSLPDLARVLGLPYATLYHYTRRGGRPSLATAARLARKCGIPVAAWTEEAGGAP